MTQDIDTWQLQYFLTYTFQILDAVQHGLNRVEEKKKSNHISPSVVTKLAANQAFGGIAWGRDSCLLDSCLPDSCLTDSCLSDSCLTDSCLSDSCQLDSCLTFRPEQWCCYLYFTQLYSGFSPIIWFGSYPSGISCMHSTSTFSYVMFYTVYCMLLTVLFIFCYWSNSQAKFYCTVHKFVFSTLIL